MVPAKKIDEKDLPSHIQATVSRKIPFLEQKEWDLKKNVAISEKEIIRRALLTFGSQRKAAGPLGIDRSKPIPQGQALRHHVRIDNPKSPTQSKQVTRHV